MMFISAVSYANAVAGNTSVTKSMHKARTGGRPKGQPKAKCKKMGKTWSHTHHVKKASS